MAPFSRKGSAVKNEDLVTEIIPTSDVVFARSGVQFFHSVRLKRTMGNDGAVHQTVSTGDLVAVYDEDHPEITKHFKIGPWRPQSWRVGQVLGIVSKLAEQKQHRQYEAIVQWLLPLQYLQDHDKKNSDQRLVCEEELKTIVKTMRPNFMLWQQQRQDATTEEGGAPDLHCVVALTRVLPAAATLLEWKAFTNHQYPTVLRPGCWEVYFHCHKMLPKTPGGKPDTCSSHDFVTTDSAPPVTVTAGWKQLFLPDLLGLSANHHSKLVVAMTSSYDATLYQKPAVDRFQPITDTSTSFKNDHSAATTSTAAASSADASDETRRSKNARKATNVVPKRSATTTKTTILPKQEKKAVPNCANKKADNVKKNTAKVVVQQLPRRNTRADVPSEDTDIKTVSSMSEDVERLKTIPLSDVVFAKPGVQLFHSFQLKRTMEDGTVVLQTVSTGDLVAVADKDHPEITKHFKLEPWYQRSWRVGQVLGLVSQLAEQNQQHKHLAVVQWLLPVQYIQDHDKNNRDQRLICEKELKTIVKTMRPNFMLWQQQRQYATTEVDGAPDLHSIVALSRVLPAAVTLSHWKDFKDKQRPTVLAPGCWEFYFHCHKMLPKTPGGKSDPCSPNDFVTPNSAPPATVLAGWKQLVLPDFLGLAANHHSKLVEAMTSAYDATVYQKPAVDRFRLFTDTSTFCKNDRSVATTSTAAASTADASDETRRSKNARKANKVLPKVKATKTKTKVVPKAKATKPKTKPAKAKTAASKGANQKKVNPNKSSAKADAQQRPRQDRNETVDDCNVVSTSDGAATSFGESKGIRQSTRLHVSSIAHSAKKNANCKRTAIVALKQRPTKTARFADNNEIETETTVTEMQPSLDDENNDPNQEQTHHNVSTLNKDRSGSLASRNEGRGRTKAWTSVPPFYVDHAKDIEYFSEIDVEPPYNNFALKPSACLNPCDRIWTVRLGDPIILHNATSAGKTVYQCDVRPLAKSQTYWPYSVPWAIGEVVTIMRRRAKPGAPASAASNQSSIPDDARGIQLEIRWFYRAKELSSSMKNDTQLNDLLCEEICESDHFDEVEPSNILAPATLHETIQSVTVGNHHLGMPLVEFHCQRFWSVHGKSEKPVGSLKGRIERGRLHSKYIGKDASLRAALQSNFNFNSLCVETLPPSTTDASPYVEAFTRVIHKLSLTDASKEAYENGAVLVGRENERKHIMSFVRASISGDAEESTKASLFVAGPPGTGKTASVRAVISELQREQSAGKLTGFDFITLNGMEMRDPFEAYVKLWEELEDENVQCNAETAASRLEALFSGKAVSGADESERVVVVLLDEIDYLVTKKQSVLYNFFDWPSRSLESKSKRRLVVIGVSNTLNLPERLHPRVQSRIGSRRVFFKSYSVNETVAILNAKLQQASPNYEVFDQDAILYASKKTAALSGDIRKAFQICRSAAEMILNEANHASNLLACPMVRIKDVLKVSRDSTNAAQPRSVSLCTSFDVLFLVALAALSKTTGREYGGFDVEEIVTKMESMAHAAGDPLYLPPPTLSETLGILSRLRDVHLVSMETPRNASMSFRASLAGSGGAWPLVSMVMDDLAILLALKDTPHHDLAQKYLARANFS